MTPERWKSLTQLQRCSMYIAMTVRNFMEDFHCVHLSDAQMAELNPIIREAIITALRDWEQATETMSPRAVEKFGWTVMMIPDYWEIPKPRARRRY